MRVILSAKKVVTKRRNVCQCMEDDIHVVICLGSRRGWRGEGVESRGKGERRRRRRRDVEGGKKRIRGGGKGASKE